MSLPVIASTVASAAPVVAAGAKTVATAAQALRHPVTAVVAVTAIAGLTLIAIKKKNFSMKVAGFSLNASD